MKKFLLIFVSISLALFVLKGIFFRATVKYQIINSRTTKELYNSDFKVYIDNNSKEELTMNQIIRKSRKITSNVLKFSKRSNSNNPNDLFPSGITNCIGYAKFYATVFNYLAQKNNLSDQWKAECYVGHLYFFNKNVHNWFKSSFFKDHDFVVITNTKTGEKIAVDPSLYDYSFIRKVKLME